MVGVRLSTASVILHMFYDGSVRMNSFSQDQVDEFTEILRYAEDTLIAAEDDVAYLEDPPEKYKELTEDLKALLQSCREYYDFISVPPVVYWDPDGYSYAAAKYETPVSDQLSDLLEEYPDLYLEEE